MSSNRQSDIERNDTKENEKRKEDEERFLLSQSQHDRERGGGTPVGGVSSDSRSHQSTSTSSTTSTTSDRGFLLRLLRFGLIVFVALALLSLYRVVRSIAEGGMDGTTTVVVTGGSGNRAPATYDAHMSAVQSGNTGTEAKVVPVVTGGSSSSSSRSSSSSSRSGMGGTESNSGEVTSVDDLTQSSASSPHFDPNSMNFIRRRVRTLEL